MVSKINPHTFPSRVEEARALARFAKIHDDNGRKFTVTMTGHDDKRYMVILKWIKTGKDWALESECLLDTSHGHEACKGNRFNVCYHTMAAVIAVANSHKTKVAFTVNAEDAFRLANLKKSAHRVISRQSVEYIWMVS